jgi:hypothetical protein
MLNGRRLRHATRLRGRPDGNRDDFVKLRDRDVGVPDVAAELVEAPFRDVLADQVHLRA